MEGQPFSRLRVALEFGTLTAAIVATVAALAEWSTPLDLLW
jgi:hypothetical protein